MAVFSVLAVGSYNLLRSVRATYEAADASWVRLDSLQRTLVTVQKDFSQLAMRPIRNGAGEREAALVAAGPDKVTFTRYGWRNFTRAPRSDLQRVRYVFKGGELLRQYQTALDPAIEEPWREQRLQDNLKGFAFRFMDEKKAWHSTWPPVGARQKERFHMLPFAIEVKLEHEDLGAITQRIPGVLWSPEAVSANSAGTTGSPPQQGQAPRRGPPPSSASSDGASRGFLYPGETR